MNSEEKQLPKAIHEGVIKLGEIELKTYILDTGERIIGAESMEKFIDYMSNGGLFTEEEVTELAKFTKGI